MTETTEDPRRLVNEALGRLEKSQKANTIALWTMVALSWLAGIALLVLRHFWGVTGEGCPGAAERLHWYFFGAACLGGIGCVAGLTVLWTRPKRFP